MADNSQGAHQGAGLRNPGRKGLQALHRALVPAPGPARQHASCARAGVAPAHAGALPRRCRGPTFMAGPRRACRHWNPAVYCPARARAGLRAEDGVDMLCREAYLDDAEVAQVRGAAPCILVAHGMQGALRAAVWAPLCRAAARALLCRLPAGARSLRSRPCAHDTCLLHACPYSAGPCEPGARPAARQVFGKPRAEYAKLPKWRQQMAKKAVGLF